MKRWNGWGEASIRVDLPGSGIDFLKSITGSPRPQADLSRSELLARLDGHKRSSAEGIPGIDTSTEARLDHARGQSFPDWVALRRGSDLVLPDGVLFPENEKDVRKAIRSVAKIGGRLIVYGGGTSVLGHINPPATKHPVIILDMSRMNRLLRYDEKSRLARFQCGVLGPDIERQLAPDGVLLGHFPQSYQYSTLGGWVATRSSGQQSLYYGRIEDTFAGGRLLTAEDEIDLPPFPASAAGPDLRHSILGSEGRLGVITEATVRVRALPEHEEFRGIFFPEWESAEEFVRQAARIRSSLSMLRLSSARETYVTLALAGHTSLIRLMEKYLSFRGIRSGKCLVVAGFTGTSRGVRRSRAEVGSIVSRLGGLDLGRPLGNAWRQNRFLGPYLRNTLWEMGWGVDTLESAVPWERVALAVDAIELALQNAADAHEEKILCYTHLSHLYTTGSGIYTTYAFRLQKDGRRTLRMWQDMKRAASEAIVRVGGTISHQHGIGKDHLPYLAAEKGNVGMDWIGSLIASADPKGLFRNGNLFQGERHG